MKIVLILNDINSEIINNINGQTFNDFFVFLVINKFISKDEIEKLKNKIYFKHMIITNLTHNFSPGSLPFVKNQILKILPEDLVLFLNDTFELEADFLKKLLNKREEIYNKIKIDFILSPIINYKRGPFIKCIGKKIYGFYIKNIIKHNKNLISDLLPGDDVLLGKTKIFKKYLFNENLKDNDYLDFCMRVKEEIPIFITKELKIYKMKDINNHNFFINKIFFN